MRLIVKYHPEINIKSRSVRRRFSKLLESNVRSIIKRIFESAHVISRWSDLLIETTELPRETELEIIDALSRIPGVDQFNEVIEYPFIDFDTAFNDVARHWQGELEGKSFCVRVKRSGKHDFTSSELERYIGGGLNQAVESAKVSLRKPDITVKAELRGDRFQVVKTHHRGLGGMPIPSQEDVLSLISGGFDSGVATYHLMRRGARTHFCFFNLGGKEHEIGVKQVSYEIWKRYSSSHKTKFIAVDFDPVVAEILTKIDNGLMGVVLKRMMMRAASQVAERLNIKALVTGESLGQVSSQTLTNLNVIDRVTETLILRPLIHLDKAEIIDTSRKIGTHDFAAAMPEYCGVISKKPTTRAVLSQIIEAESHFDMSILDDAVNNADVMDIRDIAKQAAEEVQELEQVTELPADAVVIDVRSPEEMDDSPLVLDGVEVIEIPFFRIATQFGDLDQAKPYFLYCDRGVMSRLQALLLHEHGYKEVKVYRK
ncbi:tRNA sulfurtransferase [Psychrosphaera saromensis]|uniref:tRNA sulfurtransferase n=1 Tax=Psychrosphaera saromensis TaxID=716813 RepID=A0A2S7V059_9GAMM|nr:tRNA uracil 4-sulfurtransferase ThiI [Psychrosphaera saromensis]PQJ54901.1 tRNA 4-thiouridine(8) synthase ThiI [Psychrosphaera saromensis]GHB56246.1 tRNA sulfurtransferase [Psychrosphaera saromensis]GLQ13854.1 tRNA sulfurtransferase [Psychrosphaera saromensis]